MARFEASLLPFAFPRRRAIGSHGCAIGRAAGGSRVSRSRRTDRSSMMSISCQSPRDVPLRSGNTSGSQRAAPRGCVPARWSDSWNSCGKICARGVLLGTFVVRTRSAGRYATGSLRRGRLRRRRGGGQVRPSGTEPCSGPCPRVPALRGRGGTRAVSKASFPSGGTVGSTAVEEALRRKAYDDLAPTFDEELEWHEFFTGIKLMRWWMMRQARGTSSKSRQGEHHPGKHRRSFSTPRGPDPGGPPATSNPR